jgi:hypothetical protein
MEKYRITTLVDITKTGVTRMEHGSLKYSQNSNFNSLIQAINLRGIIANDSAPKLEDGRLPDPWKGKAKHWIYEFEVERNEVYATLEHPFGFLIDDLDGIPIIDGLNNTVNFDIPAFRTKGEVFNTIVQKLG